MSSTLQKLPVRREYAGICRAAGFDIYDPNIRHPVKNDLAREVLAQQSRQPASRSAELRKSRGLFGKLLGRGLVVLITGLFLVSGSDLQAASCNPHLCGPDRQNFAMEGMAKPEEARLISDPQLTVRRVDLSLLRDPALGTALLLLLTGFLAAQLLIQRRILRNLIDKEKPMPKKQVRLLLPMAPSPERLFPDRGQPEQQIEGLSLAEAPAYLWRWHVTGASRTGKIRGENQDAFGILPANRTIAGFVLCDGAGGHAGGGQAAQAATAVMLKVLSKADPAVWLGDLTKTAIETARQYVIRQNLKGLTTAIVCVFHGDTLHYATLGDGGLSLVWPDGMVTQILAPHHVFDGPSNQITGYIGGGCNVPPRTGSVRIEPGSIVLATSDGASDLFDFNHFARHRSAYAQKIKKPLLNPANELLRALEAARDPQSGAYLHSDNMTLVMAHLDIRKPGQEPGHG